MELRDITPDDLPLYEAMYLDPRMMADLGGAISSEGLAEKLRHDVGQVRAGRWWQLVIVPDDRPDVVAGAVSVWDHELDGETVNEIGWMVLPDFQGQGVGSWAVRAVLDRARAEGRWGVIHAYPPVTNDRSNAMCRRMGFTFVEARDFVYRGRPLRCNVWVIDLRESATG